MGRDGGGRFMDDHKLPYFGPSKFQLYCSYSSLALGSPTVTCQLWFGGFRGGLVKVNLANCSLILVQFSILGPRWPKVVPISSELSHAKSHAKSFESHAKSHAESHAKSRIPSQIPRHMLCLIPRRMPQYQISNRKPCQNPCRT